MDQQPEFINIEGNNYKIADIPELAISLFNKINAAQNQVTGMAACIEATNSGISEMRRNAMALLPTPIAEPINNSPILDDGGAESAAEDSTETH